MVKSVVKRRCFTLVVPQWSTKRIYVNNGGRNTSADFFFPHEDAGGVAL